MNNRQFSETAHFKDKCVRAGVKATKRQASKFKNRKGLVADLCGISEKAKQWESLASSED